MQEDRASCFEFGPFRLNRAEGVLLRGADVVPLTVKAFEILCVLVENQSHVVPKSTLMEAAWPDCFVEENNLTQNISLLRKALGEPGGTAKYIETVPRRGYRFLPPRIEAPAAPAHGESSAGAERPYSVRALGILPFTCFGEECPEFWGLGIADALINRLSNIEQIHVRPTASVLRYEGADTDWTEAAKALRVDALLSGSIRRSGDRIRVSVQLVSVEQGRTLWAERFDEACNDIFSVEDSISRQVARTLRPKLTGDEVRKVARGGSENPEARQAFLRGRYFGSQRTEVSLRKSMRCFQDAIAADPLYAMAYAGLADTYSLLGGYGDLSPKEAYPRARAAALQALEIDPELTEARLSLGDVMLFYDWNVAASEQEYRVVLDARPDYATAHQYYSWCLMASSRFTEALEEMQRAQQLDPLSAIINTSVGFPLYFSGRFDEAAQQFRKALDLDPAFGVACVYLGRALLHNHQHQSALEWLQRGAELSQGRFQALAALAHGLAVAGHTSDARTLLARLLQGGQDTYLSPYVVATVFAGLGEAGQSLEWLTKARQDRCNQFVVFGCDPVWRELRSMSEFRDFSEFS